MPVRTKALPGVLLAVILLSSISLRSVRAQEATPVPTDATRAFEWLRFDVDLEVQPDGLLKVTERREVAFSGGPFSNGYADVPLGNIDAIEAVHVGEVSASGEFMPFRLAAEDSERTPGTYAVRQTDDEVQVDWWFTPVSDSRKKFTIEYEVRRALRVDVSGVGAGEVELRWIAIGNEVTATGPIREATTTLRIPTPVDPSLVLVSPLGYEPAPSGDWATWTWRRAPCWPGEELVVRVRFPAHVMPGIAATPTA